MKKVKLYLQKQYSDPNNKPETPKVRNKFLTQRPFDPADDGGPSKRKSASGN